MLWRLGGEGRSGFLATLEDDFRKWEDNGVLVC